MTGWELTGKRLADLLREESVQVRFEPTPAPRRAAEHLRHLRRLLGADVIVGIGGRARLSKAQWIAVRSGTAMVNCWLGTDVLTHAGRANVDVRHRTWNWTNAPWLRDELAARGLDGVEIAPIVTATFPVEARPLPPTFRVLAYAPEGREDFYGLDVILDLAERVPDVPFDVVGHRGGRPAPGNVSWLGWIEDMEPVFRSATVLVRPTRHDGTAFMVVEMLARERYALWTHDLPGAIRIADADSAEPHLRRLAHAHRSGTLPPNREAANMVKMLYHPDAIAAWLRPRLAEIAMLRWRRPPVRPLTALATGARAALRTTLGAR